MRDAEALVLTTAKIERELKARALDASRLLRRVEGPSASVACDDRTSSFAASRTTSSFPRPRRGARMRRETRDDA